MFANRDHPGKVSSKGIHRITERDRKIISDIAMYGAASRAQLMNLGHFTSVSRANRRLHLLYESKYLRRTYVATGLHTNETIYILGKAGAPIAAEKCGLDLVELKRQASRTPERMYLEHHLLVVTVRLLAAQTPSGIRLIDFLSERECRHEYEVVDGTRQNRKIIKPDAVAIFERHGQPCPVFIEVDRGHVSIPQMARSFLRYGQYWIDGAFNNAYDTDPQIAFTVAVITTAGPRRIRNLSQFARRLPVPVKFATFEDVQSKGLLSTSWYGTSGGGPGSLWGDPGGLPE